MKKGVGEKDVFLTTFFYKGEREREREFEFTRDNGCKMAVLSLIESLWQNLCFYASLFC